MEPTTEPIIFQTEGGVARITLNRPEKRNALNDKLIESLKLAIAAAEGDQNTRVVLLRGAGPDFCSGADLSVLKKISESSIYENLVDAEQLVKLFRQIRQANIPVIAAVHGRALAGGCGLATACDIVLASASARFGYPEVKIGFVPAIVMAILRRNVSEKRAFELMSCGVEIGASEAAAFGLVNQVFEDEKFDSEIDNYLLGFAKTSRTAISLSKKLLYQMDGMNFDSALDAGASINAIARMTDDCQKGIAKFLERNKSEESGD
jgi:methylglutaconyl-CoA hydratase